MRRRISILATVMTMALAAVSVASASVRPFNQVTGGVTLAGPTQYLEFNAFDFGGLAPARGTVTYSNPSAFGVGVSYQAQVYCAVVDPASRTATFGYVIPAGTGFGLDGLGIIWTVTDGGSPGAGNDIAGFSVLGSLTGTRSDCTGTSPANYSITDGNLVVH